MKGVKAMDETAYFIEREDFKRMDEGKESLYVKFWSPEQAKYHFIRTFNSLRKQLKEQNND